MNGCQIEKHELTLSESEVVRIHFYSQIKKMSETEKKVPKLKLIESESENVRTFNTNRKMSDFSNLENVRI